METKSNLGIIAALVIILAVAGVGVAIKYSQGSSDSTGKQNTESSTEENNPAAKVEPPEVMVTDANFEEEVVNYKGIVLVDMFSPTCSYCQKVGPIITEIAKETEGKYKVGKLNVLTESKTTGNFKIESVPALIFFKDGQEVKRLIGAQPKDKILEALAEVAK